MPDNDDLYIIAVPLSIFAIQAVMIIIKLYYCLDIPWLILILPSLILGIFIGLMFIIFLIYLIICKVKE